MSFGNRTVALHLLRGLVGFGALAMALAAPISPWWAGLLVPLALVALKGCPMCWTVGLIETMALRLHARQDGHQDAREVTSRPLRAND